MIVRTFIGVPVAPTVELEAVLDELAKMGRTVKPVDAASMHITLKFLGDTPQTDVERLKEIVLEHAAAMPRLTLPLIGLDAFPNRDDPSVVWAAMSGTEPIRNLAEAIEAAVEPLGFARENRSYKPHLTLARVRAGRGGIPQAGLTLLQEHATTTFGSVSLEEAVLYESKPGLGGPTYEPLATGKFRE